MKKTIVEEEKRGYVAPEMALLSFSIENTPLCSSNEDLGDDEPIN